MTDRTNIIQGRFLFSFDLKSKSHVRMIAWKSFENMFISKTNLARFVRKGNNHIRQSILECFRFVYFHRFRFRLISNINALKLVKADKSKITDHG